MKSYQALAIKLRKDSRYVSITQWRMDSSCLNEHDPLEADQTRYDIEEAKFES